MAVNRRIGTRVSGRVALCAAIACAAALSPACGYGPAPTKVKRGASVRAEGELGRQLVRVAAAGDIACATAESRPGCRAAETASLVRRLDPGLVLALGDLAYEDGSLGEFKEGYAPTWGAFRQRTFPVPGNHEYGTAGAAGYRQWWGTAATPNGHTWHSRRIGSWLLLGLDSNCSEVGGCGPGSPQGRWLAAELRQAPACVLALWHHPRRSSGPHGDNESVDPLWRALSRARADVVLNGHDHDYERFSPLDEEAKPAAKGVREFVVGTGGKQPYPLVGNSPGSQASVQGLAGVLDLRLMRRGWAWRFVTADGRVRDSGRSSCGG